MPNRFRKISDRPLALRISAMKLLRR